MYLDFLSAADGTPLTKKFTLDEHGDIQTSSYPFVKNFTSARVEVNTLSEFADALKAAANEGMCLLKGNLDQELTNESRAGHTSPLTKTQWICLDLDFYDGFDSVRDILTSIDPALNTISYIFQHSASAGIHGKAGLRGHVFIMLKKPVMPDVLKNWLINKNLTGPGLSKHLVLSANGLTLKYPLDVSTCQNDKLLYIAAPTLDGIDDPLKGNRIELIEGEYSQYDFNPASINAGQNHALAEKFIKKLRKQAQLPNRTPKYSEHSGFQILLNPDKATVTDLKTERGFTYLNLNNGDSWAYYFPIDNPEIVHNFKGEPSVYLKDIDPELYRQYKSALTPEQKAEEEIPVVFRDRVTDAYYNGFFYPEKHSLEVHQVNSIFRAKQFLAQYNQVLPDPVPDFDFRFDPTSAVIYDEDTKVANRFQPSSYLLSSKLPVTTVIPPITNRILRSVTGDSEESFDYFINWLAYIFQTRKKSGTAWVLHGVEGTGKGLLLHKILRPLFGPEHVSEYTIQSFADQFNSNIETDLISFVDECHIESGKEGTAFMNKMKNMITEPQIVIRAMRANPVLRDTYNNFIFATNHQDPLPLSARDRRFNIADPQYTPLEISNEEVEAINGELSMFAGFLRHFEVDATKARSTLQNESKQLMTEAGENTIDEFFRSVLQGDLDYFLGYRPHSAAARGFTDGPIYEKALEYWCQHVGEEVKISTHDILAAYNFTRKQSISQAAFGRMCRVHGLDNRPMRVDDTIIRGFTMVWKCENIDELESFLKEKGLSNGKSRTGSTA